MISEFNLCREQALFCPAHRDGCYGLVMIVVIVSEVGHSHICSFLANTRSHGCSGASVWLIHAHVI